MFISDENGIILSVNPAFVALSGYTYRELVALNAIEINPEIRSREFYILLQRCVESKQPWEGEMSDCHKDGSLFFKLLMINMIMDDNNNCRYVGTFLDMSRIEAVNQKLWYQANFDKLTELPNRHMFFEQIQQQMDKARRYVHQMGLIYLDFTNFEEINEALGYDVGNVLLKEVAARIGNSIGDSDLLYRIGGVEFTIIVPNINDVDEIDLIARKIIQEISSGFTVENGNMLNITTNMGIVVYPDDGDTPDKLLKYADHAMFVSKKEGKNGFRHFKRSMQLDTRASHGSDLTE
jgi:diguanylate cyclase (GGDEF)-like protein/PAS domain S-box-containing protein